jgi:putative colanic acid biosynthesis acetyltransferase WcaF
MRATLKPLHINIWDKLGRGVWQLIWLAFFRLSPVPLHWWRSFLLRLFGATVGRRSRIYPSVKVWAPWNLSVGDYATIGPNVDCYSVSKISIGNRSTVSQYSYLCTASRDLESEDLSLIVAPISIGERCWIAADVFVAPGCSLEDQSVVMARSTLLENVGRKEVYGGYPAKKIRLRC